MKTNLLGRTVRFLDSVLDTQRHCDENLIPWLDSNCGEIVGIDYEDANLFVFVKHGLTGAVLGPSYITQFSVQ